MWLPLSISPQLPHAKVAEHLAQSLQECSDVQEISATLSGPGNEMPEAKIRELEIEFERLTSKIDNLKSQNDLIALTLDESKAHCDHLSVLIGKYESNNTALQLAMSYSDQSMEAYGVLVSLHNSQIYVFHYTYELTLQIFLLSLYDIYMIFYYQSHSLKSDY